MAFVVPRHVGSSQTMYRSRVPCIGRWVLHYSHHLGSPRTLILLQNPRFRGLHVSQTQTIHLPKDPWVPWTLVHQYLTLVHCDAGPQTPSVITNTIQAPGKYLSLALWPETTMTVSSAMRVRGSCCCQHWRCLSLSTLDTALKDREDLSMESIQIRAKTNKLPHQILPPRVHAIDSYVTKYGSLVTWCVPVSCQECVVKFLSLGQSDRLEITSVSFHFYRPCFERV